MTDYIHTQKKHILIYLFVFLPLFFQSPSAFSENILKWDSATPYHTDYNIYYRKHYFSYYAGKNHISSRELTSFSTNNSTASCNLDEVLDLIFDNHPLYLSITKFCFSVSADIASGDDESDLSSEVCMYNYFRISMDNINTDPFNFQFISKLLLNENTDFMLFPKINFKGVVQQEATFFQESNQFYAQGTFKKGLETYNWEMEGDGNFSSDNAISGLFSVFTDSDFEPITDNFTAYRVP